jgi:hypothetical protein
VRARKMGRAVGMRRERAWTRLLYYWDASTSCASCARTQLERELGMSFVKQLECSQFFSSLTTLAWVIVPTCQAHVCMQRAATAHPVVNIFCKNKLYACKCM